MMTPFRNCCAWFMLFNNIFGRLGRAMEGRYRDPIDDFSAARNAISSCNAISVVHKVLKNATMASLLMISGCRKKLFSETLNCQALWLVVLHRKK